MSRYKNNFKSLLARKWLMVNDLSTTFVLGDYDNLVDIPRRVVVAAGANYNLKPGPSTLAWNNFLEYSLVNLRVGKGLDYDKIDKPSTKETKKRRNIYEVTWSVVDKPQFKSVTKMMYEYLTGQKTIKALIQDYHITYKKFNLIRKELYRAGRLNDRKIIDVIKYDIRDLKEAMFWYKAKNKNRFKLTRGQRNHYSVIMKEVVNSLKQGAGITK